MFRKKLTVQNQFQKLKLEGLVAKRPLINSREKDAQKEQIDALKELIEQELEDSINAETFTDAVITPTGITYERSQIEDWLTRNQTDPTSCTPLTSKDLLPNEPVNAVIESFEKAKDLKDLKERLNECFCCPLSGLRFTDPVVAKNGITYERQAINDYLLEKSTIPGFTMEEVFANPDCLMFFDNLIIKNILQKLEAELSKTDDVEENIDEAPNDLDIKLNKHISALFNFVIEREKTNKFGDVGWGYSKKDKIDAARKLISVLTGKQPIDVIDQKTLAILLNGDLGKIAKPALQFFLVYENQIKPFFTSPEELAEKEEKEKEQIRLNI